MLALYAATKAAQATSVLPDLNMRLRPSDSTPWTILVVLTLITLLPAILMCMTPLVRLMVVFHFCDRHSVRRPPRRIRLFLALG